MFIDAILASAGVSHDCWHHHRNQNVWLSFEDFIHSQTNITKKPRQFLVTSILLIHLLVNKLTLILLNA